MIEEIVRYQAHTKCSWQYPSNRPSRTTAAPVLPKHPFPATIWLLFNAPVLPPLHRLGQWPHLPQLPLHRPQGSPSLQLFYTSYRPGPQRYVGGTVAPIQIAQFLAGILPQFRDLPHEMDFSGVHFIFISPFTHIISPVARRSSPPSAIQQQNILTSHLAVMKCLQFHLKESKSNIQNWP